MKGNPAPRGSAKIASDYYPLAPEMMYYGGADKANDIVFGEYVEVRVPGAGKRWTSQGLAERRNMTGRRIRVGFRQAHLEQSPHFSGALQGAVEHHAEHVAQWPRWR